MTEDDYPVEPDDLDEDDEWLCGRCSRADDCKVRYQRLIEQQCVQWAEANSAAEHAYDVQRREYDSDVRAWQLSDPSYR
jgi:hypothetical protein